MSKKNVCILCTANLKHMTLISLYTKVLAEANQEFDIIYLDKYGEIEDYKTARKLYRYELYLESNWSFAKKLLHYWSFRTYAINIIKQNNYDFIIVWNEFTAFMFSDFLKKRYAGRCCINIRDQNFNRNPIAQMRYGQAVKASCFSTISSERFRDVFPKSNYLFVHSLNYKVMEDIQPVKEKRSLEFPIRIMFIGRMSYPESIYLTMNSLGNDQRFELWYVGAGCEDLQPYVEEHHYKNIIIHGAFEPDQTASFLEHADIIYSLNKENDIHSDTLLPIKLYYAIGKHIPILVYRSSFTYEYASKYGFDIGITSDDFDQLGDLIYLRYKSLNQADINMGCEKALEEIFCTHRELNNKIREYIL